MKTLELNYDSAHDFVNKNSHRGYFWDGWDIVRWVPNNSGFMSKNGMFRNSQWGVSYRFNLNDSGSWMVKAPNNV